MSRDGHLFDCLEWYSPWGWLSLHHSANTFWAASMGQVYGTIQKRFLHFFWKGGWGGRWRVGLSLKDENETARQWVGEKVFFNTLHWRLALSISFTEDESSSQKLRSWSLQLAKKTFSPTPPPPPSVCQPTVSAGHQCRGPCHQIGRWGRGPNWTLKDEKEVEGTQSNRVRGLLPSLLLSGHFLWALHLLREDDLCKDWNLILASREGTNKTFALYFF